MQLDLFAAVAEVEADQRLRAGIDRTPVPLFEDLPPVHELHRIRDEWIAEHGRFGAAASLHLWRLGPTVPGSFLDTDVLAERFGGPCAATVLYLDLRGDFHGMDRTPCSCVGDLYYRGACLGCGWSSPHTRDGENAAAEDALDHHHPGWRDLPLVDRCPERGTSRAQIAKVDRWAAAVNAVYPAGWLAAGGPIRTARQPMGSRHVPNATPWAGYDVGVITTERNAP